MFRKLFLSVMTFALFGLLADRAVLAQTSGAEGDAPPAKASKSRRKVTVKLPDAYRSKDADKDGQIGLYEWSRTDYATFRKLDLNGDGFLTAQELLRKDSSKRYSAPAAAATPSSTKLESKPESKADSTTEDPVVASTTQKTEGETPAEPADPASTTGRSDAERQFDLLDKDQNGKITEEEFKKSILTSLKFKNAGIVLDFPVGRDEFLRLYPAPAK